MSKILEKFNILDRILVYLIIKFIRFYQKTLSFDHGFLKIFYPFGYCRFRPTCSEYAINALFQYGFIKGSYLTMWRVLRCNPWNKGGFDPVNKSKK